MVVSECAGKWRFFNFEQITESLERVDADLHSKIGESLFRVIEHPHDPRGLVWFEQRVGSFRGSRVVQVAENWFLTYIGPASKNTHEILERHRGHNHIDHSTEGG